MTDRQHRPLRRSHTNAPDLWSVRQLLHIVPLLALTVTIGGCAPPPDARVAAAYRDGSVEILAYVCAGYVPVAVEIYEVGEDGEGVWSVAAPHMDTNTHDRDTVLRVGLFEIPPGWELVMDTMDSLRAGRTYEVAFTTLQGQDSVIQFNLEDLESLQGRVWTGQTDREGAVSEADFIDTAGSDCH